MGYRIQFFKRFIAVALTPLMLGGCDQSTEANRKNASAQNRSVDSNEQRLAKEREQLKVECKESAAKQRADHDHNFAAGRYWEAASAIRVCAEALEDESLRSLVAVSEKRYYVSEINSRKTSARDKANAIERMIRDYPEEGKRYESRLAQLVVQADVEYKSAEAQRKKSKGVIIGMTPEDVIASSWGKPKSINRTTYANSVREQWVYGIGNYLYFENGKLTVIQN